MPGLALRDCMIRDFFSSSRAFRIGVQKVGHWLGGGA